MVGTRHLVNVCAPKETLAEEFSRLVKEYNTGEGSEKEEAWNLIADFALANSLRICMALDKCWPAAPPHSP
jgi:hypothetical protein